jgi:ArsR family transcriptional regulator
MQRLLRLLSDPTRVRILAAVESEELAVNEIADVLAMSQSRISNHLRLLRDAEALRDRREGTWTFYRNALPQSERAAPLWSAVRKGLDKDAQLRADESRRRSVLERRRRRSREHFATGGASPGAARDVSLESGCLREEILAALVPADLQVVDAGCGDGFLTELLSERFAEVLAVDHSPQRLAEARKRVADGRVRFEAGEIEDLPLEDRSRDAVLLSMVLHHVPEIGAVLQEAWRVLRPGGTIVIADLVPHQDESMRQSMGDLRLGLEADALTRELGDAGFRDARILPARDRLVVGRDRTFDLFLATARRAPARRRATKNKTSK